MPAKIRSDGRCGVFAGNSVWSTSERLVVEVPTIHAIQVHFPFLFLSLSKNPQRAVIATYTCFLTNFTSYNQWTYRPNNAWAICNVANPTKFWVGHGLPGLPCRPSPMLGTPMSHPTYSVNLFPSFAFRVNSVVPLLSIFADELEWVLRVATAFERYIVP